MLLHAEEAGAGNGQEVTGALDDQFISVALRYKPSKAGSMSKMFDIPLKQFNEQPETVELKIKIISSLRRNTCGSDKKLLWFTLEKVI